MNEHEKQIVKFKSHAEKNLPSEFAVIEYLLDEIKSEYVKMAAETIKEGTYDREYGNVFHCDKANRELAKRNCLVIRNIVLKLGKRF